MKIKHDTFDIPEQRKAYVVYKLDLRGGSHYVGYSGNLLQRVRQHGTRTYRGRILKIEILFESDYKKVAQQAEAFFIDLDFDNNTNKIVTGKKKLALADKAEENLHKEIRELTEDVIRLENELLESQDS